MQIRQITATMDSYSFWFEFPPRIRTEDEIGTIENNYRMMYEFGKSLGMGKRGKRKVANTCVKMWMAYGEETDNDVWRAWALAYKQLLLETHSNRKECMCDKCIQKRMEVAIQDGEPSYWEWSKYGR